ncbi:acyltransferase [Flavobacterium ovatum]|uniref:acyltransferase n=1 Tax=Flavobacterium ovatum TaxID=1928857 RepID=UPI00344E5E5E
MKFTYFTQQSFFVLRFRYLKKIASFFRKKLLQIQGMRIATGVNVPKIYTTWPHKVFLGKNCILEHNINFKYDGIWSKEPSIIIENDVFLGFGCEFNISSKIEIKQFAMIASGCKFIDHDHGIALDSVMNGQSPIEKPIVIEEYVWLGCNVIVLKGVNIGKGAVVAAGAVVTKSIPSNEIWAGVPAKKIGKRK